MKTKRLLYISLLITLLTGCSKDDEADLTKLNMTNIQGTWKITTALGTEWVWKNGRGEKGTQGIDAESSGALITITSDKLSFGSPDKTAKYKLDVANKTFSLLKEDETPVSGAGVFDIINFDGKMMQLNNIKPTKEADYEFREGWDFPKYYEKEWTMTKQ